MIHVIPEDDTQEHEQKAACWCVPLLKFSGDEPAYIHNSRDEREKTPNGKRWLAVTV